MNLGYKLGLRAIKTAISVFLCLLIAYILNRTDTLFASIAAIICLQPTYNKTFSSKINSYCTLLLEAEVTDAINKYNIKVNGYDAVKNNLIRARDDLSTDALRLENRLLFNSSYFWTTDTVRNTIYNYTSDVFFTNLSNYSRLTSVIEESSIWYVNEFGGNR